MQVNVSFSFAKVYNISELDVVQGQIFSLLTDNEGESNWFSNNDPVLSLNVNGNNAVVEATSLGTAIIQIQNRFFEVLKTLTINVVSEIVEPATTLGLIAEGVEPK